PGCSVTEALGPGCVKTLRGTTAPAILRLVVTLSAKKRKNSSSARRYDQISSRFRTAWARSGHFGGARDLHIRASQRRAVPQVERAKVGRAMATARLAAARLPTVPRPLFRVERAMTAKGLPYMLPRVALR